MLLLKNLIGLSKNLNAFFMKCRAEDGKGLRKRITPLIAGCIVGLIAALCQVVFRVYPPPAYGICIACHARDLANWLINHMFGLSLGLAPVSKDVPVITTLGVILGAFTAAVRNKEFKVKNMKNPVKSFFLGFLVMMFALLLGSCPIRTILRIAYGDAIAILGWFAIMLGVVFGAEAIRWHARRRLKFEEAHENAV